jgi:hypothetical protein
MGRAAAAALVEATMLIEAAGLVEPAALVEATMLVEAAGLVEATMLVEATAALIETVRIDTQRVGTPVESFARPAARLPRVGSRGQA